MRDRSLSTVLRQPARQPVPGRRDRSPSASTRGETGPVRGETGSRTLNFRGRGLSGFCRSRWSIWPFHPLLSSFLPFTPILEREEEREKKKKKKRRRRSSLEALKLQPFPLSHPLEAWSLLLELCDMRTWYLRQVIACLPLCSFAHACEGRSLQAGTPEIAIRDTYSPCGIGRRSGLPWARLIPRVEMKTTMGPLGSAPARQPTEPSAPAEARDRGKGVA
uniref:Uncharacterized protein n=1 Tax=Ananas comosus var. bracteatus TaxID=296719 RepID=A0A6V7PGM7_ANACO|nr:unnamed protein product [Ananas comosus var. bracteatus]